LWDEVSSCKKGIPPQEAWEQVIEPCINTRWSPERALVYNSPNPGRAVFISTAKGYNFFYDLCNRHESSKNWAFYKYDYRTSPYLDAKLIESLATEMDPVTYASEYLAQFKDSGIGVFYCFDRLTHVRKDLEDFEPNETIHCAIDFNVGIQATSLFALRGNQIHVIHEIKGHPDTESLAQTISTKYKGHRIMAYPDPTGRSRKTSASVGRTDFFILESYGIQTCAHKGSPSIVDSVAAVNRMLKTANGKVNLYVHARCKGVIESLERTKWTDRNTDLATIDKVDGVEHFSDGLRYACEYLFPITANKALTHKGKTF
jgi:hypothetical protein